MSQDVILLPLGWGLGIISSLITDIFLLMRGISAPDQPVTGQSGIFAPDRSVTGQQVSSILKSAQASHSGTATVSVGQPQEPKP